MQKLVHSWLTVPDKVKGTVVSQMWNTFTLLMALKKNPKASYACVLSAFSLLNWAAVLKRWYDEYGPLFCQHLLNGESLVSHASIPWPQQIKKPWLFCQLLIGDGTRVHAGHKSNFSTYSKTDQPFEGSGIFIREQHLRLEHEWRWILVPYLCTVSDDSHLWTELHKHLWHDGIYLLSAHQYGQKSKDKVKVMTRLTVETLTLKTSANTFSFSPAATWQQYKKPHQSVVSCGDDWKASIAVACAFFWAFDQ